MKSVPLFSIFKNKSPILRLTLMLIVALVLINSNTKSASAACGTTNIALNKTATASSVETGSGYTANLTVDGNLGTRWCFHMCSSGKPNSMKHRAIPFRH